MLRLLLLRPLLQVRRVQGQKNGREEAGVEQQPVAVDGGRHQRHVLSVNSAGVGVASRLQLQRLPPYGHHHCLLDRVPQEHCSR